MITTYEQPKPLLTNVSFADLFAEVRPHRPSRPLLKFGHLFTRGYCTVTKVRKKGHEDLAALSITPSEKLGETLAQNMIQVKGDEIYFSVISYPNGTSRLYAKYSQILGSRLVAEFDAKETRRFFRSLPKED